MADDAHGLPVDPQFFAGVDDRVQHDRVQLLNGEHDAADPFDAGVFIDAFQGLLEKMPEDLACA